MAEPLISAVITTYNRAHLVPRAVRSAQNQTYSSLEIIVVDDASTDGTVDVISAIEDSRLRLVRNSRNRGPGGAKNAGVEAARGEYLAFLDSDDEWLPQKLDRQLEAMRRPGAPPVSVTTCWMQHADGQRFLRRYLNYSNGLRAVASGEMYNFGSTSLIRRSSFAEIGPLREDLPRLEDVEWMLRFSLTGDFAVVDEPLSVISRSGWPSRAAVAECTRKFADATAPYLRTQAPKIRSLVAGTMLYENALAAWREGDRTATLQLLGRMFRASPSHLPLLLRRMARKAAQPQRPLSGA